MSLNDEISSAIQKNLPAAVAQELQSYIEQAEKDKQRIESLTKENTRLQEAKAAEHTARGAAEEKLQQHEALDQREAAITKREIHLAVEVADIRQAQAELRANDILTLVGTVFRNPVIKRTLYRNDSTMNKYDQASGQYRDVVTGHSINEDLHEE